MLQKRLLLPIPWEVTVSFGSGTARSAEQIMKASLQVDLFDPDIADGWKQGFYLKEADRKILLKSDYLRKEAELYIDYITKGDDNNKIIPLLYRASEKVALRKRVQQLEKQLVINILSPAYSEIPKQ